MIVPDGDGVFLAEARADLDECRQAVGSDFATGEDGEDVDTLGGLVVSLLGRVPVRGELITVPGGFEFEILDADPRRIKRLRIHRRAQPAAAKRRAAPAAASPQQRAPSRRLTTPACAALTAGHAADSMRADADPRPSPANHRAVGLAAAAVRHPRRRAVGAGLRALRYLPGPVPHLPVFVWLIDGSTAPDGAGLSAGSLPAALPAGAFGFGYFLAGLWWIGAAFLVDADEFAWLMPFAVIALARRARALLGPRRRASRACIWPEGWPRILVFAAALAVAEWLRGHLLTGFPWNACRLCADARRHHDAVGRRSSASGA